MVCIILPWFASYGALVASNDAEESIDSQRTEVIGNIDFGYLSLLPSILDVGDNRKVYGDVLPLGQFND